MDSEFRHRVWSGVLYFTWALIGCPVIGVAAVSSVGRTDSDALIVALVLGLPSVLAAVAGLALGRNVWAAIAGVLAAIAGGVSFLIVIGASVGN